MAETIELKVEVEGRYIIVTMPGTSFRSSYFKSAIAPGLVPSDYMMDDGDSATSRDEFVALAAKAANDKARELGWIV
jgi:hypothetical protein